VAAGLLSLALPIMRTCLIITDDGLVDRRAVQTVRLPWQQITEFRVARPGGLWSGFLAWLPAALMGGKSGRCQRGLNRGLPPRVTWTSCSGFAGSLRNALPHAVRTHLLIPNYLWRSALSGSVREQA
jgi:hypothetical protein